MKQIYEAFVYIWYDALNKKFYLGSHKGEPTDNYAHSSPLMEMFTMKTKPPHMRRKILAYGTHKEMIKLESELQSNRKERCWSRYYNINVCSPFYSGFGKGKNNPRYNGNKGKENGMYGRKGKDNPRYGTKLSEKTKNKISESQKKRLKNNPERKSIMSKEARERLSKNRSGQNNPMSRTNIERRKKQLKFGQSLMI